MRRLFAAVLVLVFSQVASASGGLLDDKGCHNDPKTKRSHCHNLPTERPTGSTTVITVDRRATDDPGDDDLYADCQEVRAMGAAPLKKGQIGYTTRLDPDRDGLACD